MQDSIKLRWTGGVFNTFELGQAVVYHEGTAPIAGLVNGGTYYVVASTNQTNLQGDTRFADAQVIGLAETRERGARRRADRHRPELGERATSSRRSTCSTPTSRPASASSPRSTREEKCGASAGLKNENANTNLWAKFKEKIGTNVPDLIFTKLTKGYADNQAKANAVPQTT